MARVWIETADDDATQIDVFPFGSLAMLAVAKPSLVRRIAAPAIGALIALVAIVAIQLASSSESMTAHAELQPPIVERVAVAAVALAAPIVERAPVAAPAPGVEPETREVKKSPAAKKRTRSRVGRAPVRVDASTPLGVLRPR